MSTERLDAAVSARPSLDSQLFSSPFESLTSGSSQATVISDMRGGNTSADNYLPDLKIEGLAASPNTADQSADQSAAQSAAPRSDGAIETARSYWSDYADDSVRQGGLKGFANYVFGNTMGAIVEGVQSAKDAREYWGDVASKSDSEVTRVIAGAAHDLLVPAAVLDHMGTALNDTGNVNFNQVESGLKAGVLPAFYNGGKDVEKTLNWLDQQIPNDGKPETMDRRTALLVALASAEAQKLTSDPKQQEEIAYDRLFSLRAGIVSYDKQLPPQMRGRELDQDIAGAEHVFELSKRVAADTMEVAIPGMGRKEIPNNGFVTAPLWAGITSGYAVLKSAGVLGGSTAGEHQTSWEMAGIMRGLEINRR
jgi:hypothetical protein